MPSQVSIKYFLAAARTESFTKAAEELYMTRQAVNRQIAALEKELGVSLFCRTTARVSLTPAGELYVRFFKHTLTQWEELGRRAKLLTIGQSQTIHIGCLYDIDLSEQALGAIETCRSRGYDLNIDWERREPHDLLTPLLSGRLDLVISFGGTLAEFRQPELLSSFCLTQARALLVVRSSHPLVRPGAMARDFQNEPCFLSAQMHSTDQKQRAFQHEWDNYGIHFSDVRVVPNRETMQTMVEMGRGVTVCTSLGRFPKHPQLTSFPLDRMQNILCIWRSSEQREPVLALVEALKQQT